MVQTTLELPKIWPVTCHTNQVGPGSTFVAINGVRQSGSKYILQALQQGATKIVLPLGMLTSELRQLIFSYGAHVLEAVDTRVALGELSAQAWGFPAQHLQIIGVTGTKGKTTSVYALYHLLRQLGKRVAMLSGVENWICDQRFTANLTTPQPDYLQMFLAHCVQAGIEYVVMEVSAQGLSLHRVDQIQFAAMIFTNFELEHSEFYADIQSYFAAKCQLFGLLKLQAPAILNADDQWLQKILSGQIELNAEKLIGFGFGGGQYQLSCIEPKLLDGLYFNLQNDREHFEFYVPQLSGKFNVYNLAGVIICLQQLGFDLAELAKGLVGFKGAPGRLEIYALPNGARGVVDYAHTPSSLKNILSLLRSATDHLIVVFGAGGGRDSIKRPMMGQIAAEWANVVILTSDNPRHEDPWQIVHQIIGLQSTERFLVEIDRAVAIKKAYQLSRSGSIIVLLGKGPDEYQQLGDHKIFFSDRQQLLSCH